MKMFVKKTKLRATFATDFETNSDSKKGELGIFMITASQIYHYNQVINQNIDNVIVKYDFLSFLEHILTLTKKEVHGNCNGGKIRLWFNNGARFDMKFIIYELSKLNYIQVISQKLKNRQFSLLEKEGVGIIHLLFKFRGTTFEIRDFKLLMNLSVAKMGKFVNVKKGSYDNYESSWYKDGEVDFDKFNWWKTSQKDREAFTYYGKKDALILGKYIYEYEKLYGECSKLTISSLSFNEGMSKIKKVHRDIKWKIDNDYDTKLSYFGGFNYTNISHLLTIEKDVVSLDMNAAYTGIMLDKVVYDSGKEIELEKYLEVENVKSDYKYLLEVNLIHFKLKDSELGKQGIIPINDKKNKNNFKFNNINNHFPIEGKDLRIWVWNEEFEVWKDMYQLQYTILRVKKFHTKKWIDTYLAPLYNERKKLKEKIELIEQGKLPKSKYSEFKIKDSVIKLKCNSFYGYFATKPEKNNYYYCKNDYEPFQKVLEGEKTTYIIGKKSHIKKGEYFRYKLINQETPKERFNIFIASYITMKQRLNVYWTMRTGLVYRLDTDGITAHKDIIKEFEKRDLISQSEISKWAIEKDKCWKYFVNLGYKAYVGNERPFFDGKEKLTFKGVHNLQVDKEVSWYDIDWSKIGGEVRKSKQEQWTINIKKIRIILSKLNKFGVLKKDNKLESY